MNLSQKDKQNITEAICHVEQKSEAELVAVIRQNISFKSYRYFTIFLVLTGLIFAFFACNLFGYIITTILIFLMILFLRNFQNIVISYLPISYVKNNAKIYAQNIFNELVKDKTKEKIGIMFYVSVSEKYVQIIVDEGIKEKISDVYWQKIVNEFVKDVKKGKFGDGYVRAIESCANILSHNFPAKNLEKNELTNEVIEL